LLLLSAVLSLLLIQHVTCYFVTCRNGATQWYFPGASYNKNDVTIHKMDVTAGSAVIHFVDYNIFSQPQRTFWDQQAKNMKCGEGGGPAVTTTRNVEPQQPQQQSINAGMIAGKTVPTTADLCLQQNGFIGPERFLTVPGSLVVCVSAALLGAPAVQVDTNDPAGAPSTRVLSWVCPSHVPH
jgi:hypothetical protein